MFANLHLVLNKFIVKLGICLVLIFLLQTALKCVLTYFCLQLLPLLFLCIVGLLQPVLILLCWILGYRLNDGQVL